MFWRKNKARTLGHARKSGTHTVQQAADIPLGIIDRGVDLFPVIIPKIANLKQAINEHAQALLGRDTARRYVRGFDQTQKLEVLHDVAYGCSAHLFRKAPRQRPRSHGPT